MRRFSAIVLLLGLAVPCLATRILVPMDEVQKDNKLEVVRSLSLTEAEIPVAQYNDFKAMLLKWSDENYKRLVFSVEN